MKQTQNVELGELLLLMNIGSKMDCSHSIIAKSKPMDYLHNGNRIFDLARQKQSRYNQKILPYKEIALELNYSRMPAESKKRPAYFLNTMERYIKTQLSTMNKEEFPDKGISFFYDLIGVYKDQVSITRPNERNYELSLTDAVYHGVSSLMFQVQDQVELFGAVLSSSKKPSGYYMYKSRPNDCHLLLRSETLVSALTFLNSIYNVVQKLKKADPDGVVMTLIKVHYEEIFSWNWQIGKKIVPEIFSGLLFKNGYSLDPDTLTYTKPGNTQTLELDNLEDYQSTAGDLYTAFILLHTDHPIPAMSLFRYWNGRYYFFPYVLNVYFDTLYEMLEISSDIKDNILKRSQTHIATSYITKKNIPQKILSAMESSKFNNYFGYVEFDEDIDLAAVQRIESEFQKLNKELFQQAVHKDVILRFRKLGKHKAGGLYYPDLHTLCVDLHNPSSFIHEYLHMLDDQLGDLSISTGFNNIVKVYRTVVKEQLAALPEGDKQVLKGNSKYNLKYYLNRSEIFARCGELYFIRLLHVKSSLLKPDPKTDFAYPVSPVLEQLIKEYFEGLLSNLPGPQ